ncbi:MAG: hypothetical protein Q9193_007321, partial [Seirophora villosa]
MKKEEEGRGEEKKRKKKRKEGTKPSLAAIIRSMMILVMSVHGISPSIPKGKRSPPPRITSTHLQLPPTRRQIPQHEELKPILRPNPHPRHASPELLRAIGQDPPDADPERCPQQSAPFIGIHAELQPGVRHKQSPRDVLEQVAHDGAGVGVGDVIVCEVAEPVRGLVVVVAGFLPPE